MKFSILPTISFMVAAGTIGQILGGQVPATLAHGPSADAASHADPAAMPAATSPVPIMGDALLLQTNDALFPKIVANASLEGTSGVNHQGVDWVAIDPKSEQALDDRVKREGIGYNKAKPLGNAKGGNTFSIEAQGAAIGGDPGQVGRWEGPYDWPVVAVHATLLPNGQVLAYDSVGNQPTESYQQHTFTRATLWNPASNSHTAINSNTGFNLFCSGLTLLNDGRVFIAGGNLNSQLAGIDKTHIFNPSNNSWSIEGTMQAARWYPATTALFNREILITGGGPTTPEIRSTNGALRALPGANANIAADRIYGWLKQAPNGQVAYLGPAPTLQYLNPSGNGSWSSFGQRDNQYRSYGSYATYNLGQVLITGGGQRNPSAVTVNLNNNAVQAASPMNRQRLQHNLTLLADGKVLATGGMQNTDQGLVDVNNGVFEAESWNPADGKWTLLSSMTVTRQYHSIAMLLPDGRVLSAGGGICGACQQQSYLAKNAEIFSPPYLFKPDGSGQLAARPGIRSVTNNLDYGKSFNISTAEAATIAKVSLVRFGGVTHSANMDQLYVPLKFFRSNGFVKATPPGNAKAAPPGYYMLFIHNNQGVPSVARILKLD
jgi:Domain of unknown function (DUF1929)